MKSILKKVILAAALAAMSAASMASCIKPDGSIDDDGSLGAKDMLPMCEPAKPAEAVAPAAPAPKAFDPGVSAPKVDKSYYQGAEKAVYHLSEKGDEKFYLAKLGNVKNHLAALEKAGVKPVIEIAMNGDGLGVLQTANKIQFDAGAKLPGLIDDLKEKGVKFRVCYNTLVGRKIHIGELYNTSAAEIVPSGVAEVARLEARGYQLIKP